MYIFLFFHFITRIKYMEKGILNVELREVECSIRWSVQLGNFECILDYEDVVKMKNKM